MRKLVYILPVLAAVGALVYVLAETLRDGGGRGGTIAPPPRELEGPPPDAVRPPPGSPGGDPADPDAGPAVAGEIERGVITGTVRIAGTGGAVVGAEVTAYRGRYSNWVVCLLLHSVYARS